MKLKPSSLFSFIALLSLLALATHISLAQPVPKYQEAMLDGKPDGLMKHIFRTIQYPEEAKEGGIQGFTLLKFKVDTIGNIDSIDVLYTPHKSLTDESIRLVISSKGKWQPAMRKGQPENSWIYLPLNFRLEDGERTITHIHDRKKEVGYVYYKQGLQQYEKGLIAEAIQSFSIAAILDRGNIDAVHNQMLILINEEDYDLACYRMKKIIEDNYSSAVLKKDMQELQSAHCKE